MILVSPPPPRFQEALLGQLQCLTSCKSRLTVGARVCQVVTEEQRERQRMSAALTWCLSGIAAEGGKERSTDAG